MQIIRTIVWVLILVALLIFTITNWTPVSVKIWEGLILETKIPALVILAFLAGLVPMWLFHRGAVWRLERRINTLENAMHNASATLAAPVEKPVPAPAPAPAATPTPVVTEPAKTPPANEGQ
ncbi:hypothetical protein NT2_02_03950 [Caenibius tardaugens NBRC 16725]|uniref:Lipopolysaccharide assembly protein A domain-containing protein n=1 Tax=Caenibius tardaugens NBRC 16725 TaxID=1219035 RepID=U3A0P6_9SPHN|nr:hypothetical protein [Caenibius tardaugens]AZI34792.1 DUF1049 domain-containing protein [Caenibius tardaugens NBRC 16725]GAD48313.1 hypothetical protein NT2_02_03950 [Caenibius tardaugens NBRC 16725]